MKNETIGLEGMEISKLIRELRYKKRISQAVLYQGLCTKKKYFQLENGETVIDELLSERLFSRLHVQYKLLDIMLDDEQFWQKECRHEINVQLHKRAWKKAEDLLKEYEEKAPKTELHRQYVLAKRAEIGLKKGQKDDGKAFLEALELTMPVDELESRLKGNGVITEDELMWYVYFRICDKPFSVEEYGILLERIEELFLSMQIYTEVYFEVAYLYAIALFETEQYVLCREVCQKTIAWLKRGVKSFRLAEFYFIDAMASMKLKHEPEEERELFQQCKMAYYVSESFGEKDAAEKIKRQCKENYGWRVTG